ncbi:MAG: oligosaccharide flippase family protein [Tannerella sp.]|jgi:O-antigen/teichoic acid export membrane protein|nr:oligosaccharide flippase family protein [Tannerella sp.]
MTEQKNNDIPASKPLKSSGLRQLAKETAIYGMSSILGRVLNWLLVPIYTRVLINTGEYGIVTNIYAWTALLLILLTYGMETGFFRFVNADKALSTKANKKGFNLPESQNVIYSTTLYSIASTSLIFIVLAITFLSPISSALGYAENKEYIAMMACIVAVDAFCCIPFAWLRYKNRPVRFAFIKLANIFLNIFLNIFFLIVCPWINARNPQLISWFYSPDYGVGYIFVANVFTTAMTLLMLVPDMMPGLKTRPNRLKLKEMLKYSYPLLILGIAGIFNQTADKILYPFIIEDKTVADAQLGIYGACFKIAVIMVMFIQAFRYAYEPFIFSRNRTNVNANVGANANTTAANANAVTNAVTNATTTTAVAAVGKQYSEAMKYFIIFALVIFLGVMFYLDIIKYFVGEQYYSGLSVVPLVMLGELFFGIYFNLSVWYKLTDQTRWGAYFSIIGCIATVLIIILFVPTFGFIACAWASVASNLLMMLLSYFIGRKRYPIKYDLRSALIYSLLAAVCYCTAMLPTFENDTVKMAYKTVILSVFLAFIYCDFKFGNLQKLIFSRFPFHKRKPKCPSF